MSESLGYGSFIIFVGVFLIKTGLGLEHIVIQLFIFTIFPLYFNIYCRTHSDQSVTSKPKV